MTVEYATTIFCLHSVCALTRNRERVVIENGGFVSSEEAAAAEDGPSGSDADVAGCAATLPTLFFRRIQQSPPIWVSSPDVYALKVIAVLYEIPHCHILNTSYMDIVTSSRE